MDCLFMEFQRNKDISHLQVSLGTQTSDSLNAMTIVSGALISAFLRNKNELDTLTTRSD